MKPSKVVVVNFTIDASDPAKEADLKEGLSTLLEVGQVLGDHGHANVVQVLVQDVEPSPSPSSPEKESHATTSDPSLN